MRPGRELIVVSICGVILAGMGCTDGREHNNAPAVLLHKSEAAGVNLARDPALREPKPTPAQAAWQDMEIGMFIHFGIETWQDKETDDEPVMENLELFNPTDVDTDQWVSVAESIGAKYIILVAKTQG